MSAKTGQTIIRSIDELDDDWLTAAMRDYGSLPESESVSVGTIEPVGEPAFAGSLFRVGLSGPAGVPASVIVKLPVGGALRPALDVITAYSREIAFYQHVAEQAPVNAPRALVALQDSEESTDFVLILEDLAPARSVDPSVGLTAEQLELVIDAIAPLHVWGWESPRLEDLEAWFPPVDSPAGQGVVEFLRQAFAMSWPITVANAGSALPDEVRALGDRFPDLMPPMAQAVARPRTLIHGDVSGANLLFGTDGALHLIDFQTVGQECGTREIAHIMSMSVPTEVRRANEVELLRRYLQRLREGGVTDYGWDELWRHYRIGLAWGLMPPVFAAARWDELPEPGRRALSTYLARASAAIVDNDCISLIDDLASAQ